MKILMVLTSHDQLGNTGRKTGIWRATGEGKACYRLHMKLLGERAAHASA
jgi:hypothetical protein